MVDGVLHLAPGAQTAEQPPATSWCQRMEILDFEFYHILLPSIHCMVFHHELHEPAVAVPQWVKKDWEGFGTYLWNIHCRKRTQNVCGQGLEPRLTSMSSRQRTLATLVGRDKISSICSSLTTSLDRRWSNTSVTSKSSTIFCRLRLKIFL